MQPHTNPPSAPWALRTLVCAAVLAWPAAQARDLANIDALGQAPLASPRKAAATATPAHVQRFTREERLGVPTFVQLNPAARASAASTGIAKSGGKDPEAAARAELKALAGLYGLSAQEVDTAPLHHVQAMAGGAHLVRLSNQRDGIEVFREHATVLLNQQLQATAIGGYLGSTQPAPSTKAAATGTLDAPAAIARALQDFGFAAAVASQLQKDAAASPGNTGAYQHWSLPADVTGDEGATLMEPARVKPVWFRLPEGLVSAFYVEVQVKEDGDDHAYAYVVARSDGRLLLRHNQTAHASDFHYRVWADPASKTPLPGPQGRNGTPHPTGTPNGYAAPLEPAALVSHANASAPWLADGATTTSGNNVQAFANRVLPNGLRTADENNCTTFDTRDMIACTTAANTFDHSYDHASTPLADSTQVAASVVNLFYTTNWLHDWFYGAGFDEASGNAQKTNYGTAGMGGDALIAQALDASGTNNANMTTPADGKSPTMRMYRFINAMKQVQVQPPANVTLSGATGAAAFGTLTFDVTQPLASTTTTWPVTNDACNALPAGSLTNKIALVYRGSCSFQQKARNAETAGAAGILIVNNDATAGASNMGADTLVPSVSIPALQVSNADGLALKAALDGGATITVRMQRATTERSSAFDNSIIAHEWGHYISNRLIGDASGLNTTHSQGLGEGWGDFHSMLLIVANADRNQPGNDQFQAAYGTGTYSTVGVEGPGSSDPDNVALFGLRRYPYSTDMGKNPLMLRHIADSNALPTTVPINANSYPNSEVHNSGEVWTSMLWECYASLLNAHDFDVAQDRMKRYLVAGYKLTPVSPTLTEARDALLAPMLAADPADYARCSAGFAKRGAGSNALVPDRYSSTNEGVVEDTSTSPVLVIDDMRLSMSASGAQRCDADEVLDSGETGALTLTVRNKGLSASASGQLALSSELPEVAFVDSVSLSVPALSVGASTTITARVRLAGLTAPSSSRITAALSYPDQQVAEQRTLHLPLHNDIVANSLATDDAEALPTAMAFGSNAAGYDNTWGVIAADTAGQPLNQRYAAIAPNAPGSHWMRTPPLTVAASGDLVVSFKHRYSFERDTASFYDGGQLMTSTDGGTTWLVVANSQYTGTLFTGSDNLASGQLAFVGDSPNYPNMTPITVNLGTVYANQTVQLAWVVQSDAAMESVGWEVDDIAISGITNTPFPKLVNDAQLCAQGPALSGIAGQTQSAPVNTAFAQALRVRLMTATGVPVAATSVAFAAPATGASASLSATSVQTDADGYAEVSASANSTAGSYSVTATAGAASTTFALTNTAAPVNPGGNGGSSAPLSISGPSPNGQGAVTITVHASTAALPASAQFAGEQFSDAAGVGVPALDGYGFPYGLAQFVLQNVGTGNAVTLRIRYPGAVPAQAEYWKYGKTTPTGAAHWYSLPMRRVDAQTIDITLTDGAQGDADATADGHITDPGGLAVPTAVAPGGAVAATPVPVSSAWMLALLVAMLAGLAWPAVRSARRADGPRPAQQQHQN